MDSRKQLASVAENPNSFAAGFSAPPPSVSPSPGQKSPAAVPTAAPWQTPKPGRPPFVSTPVTAPSVHLMRPAPTAQRYRCAACWLAMWQRLTGAHAQHHARRVVFDRWEWISKILASQSVAPQFGPRDAGEAAPTPPVLVRGSAPRYLEQRAAHQSCRWLPCPSPPMDPS